MIKRPQLWRTVDSALSQIAQAGISFLATLTFAAALEPARFGILAIYWTIWTFVMSLHRTLFGEQLIAAQANERASRGYRMFVYAWTGLGASASLLVAVISSSGDLVLGILYSILFAGSDAVRYAYIAASNTKAVSVRSLMMRVDGLRLLIAVIGYLLGRVGGMETVAMILLLSAASMWLVISVLTLPRPRPSHCLRFTRTWGRFQTQLGLQFLIGTGTAQSLPLLALGTYGPVAFAALRLAQSTLAPITLLSTAAQPAILSAFARASQAGYLRNFGTKILCGSLVIALLMTITVTSGFKMFGDIVIPAEYLESVQSLVLPVACMLSLVVVGQPGGAVIRVFRLGSVSVTGQIIGTVVMITLCLLSLSSSMRTFAWALTAGSAGTVLATYILLAIALRRRKSRNSYS